MSKSGISDYEWGLLIISGLAFLAAAIFVLWLIGELSPTGGWF